MLKVLPLILEATNISFSFDIQQFLFLCIPSFSSTMLLLCHLKRSIQFFRPRTRRLLGQNSSSCKVWIKFFCRPHWRYGGSWRFLSWTIFLHHWPKLEEPSCIDRLLTSCSLLTCSWVHTLGIPSLSISVAQNLFFLWGRQIAFLIPITWINIEKPLEAGVLEKLKKFMFYLKWLKQWGWNKGLISPIIISPSCHSESN